MGEGGWYRSNMKPQLWAALAAAILLPAASWAQIGNIVVTNAASFRIGMPPPGSIGSIFCTGLKLDGPVSSPNLPLPTQLAGISVTVGGVRAPLFAVADLGRYQQINFQVPLKANFNCDLTTEVAVAQDSVQGSATAQWHSAVQPGDFFRISGTQYGIFQHALDYSLVTEDNPAHPGETIVAYLTGLPTTTNPPSDGYPAPASPLSVVPQYNTADRISQLSLQVGGIGLWNPPPISGDSTGMSPIPFIGLTPGTVGLYQLNFTLPQNILLGDQWVYLVTTNCLGKIAGFPAAGGNCYTSGSGTQWHYSQEVRIPVR